MNLILYTSSVIKSCVSSEHFFDLRPAHATAVVEDFDLSGYKTQPTRCRRLVSSLADEGFEVAPRSAPEETHQDEWQFGL